MVPGRALLAGALLSMPISASAQSVPGAYLAGGIGANYLRASDLDIFDRQASVAFDPGWAAVLSLGWSFGNGLRVEIEGSSRGNQVQSVTRNGVRVPSGGRQRSDAAMTNIFFEAAVPGLAFVRPYIGGGLGYAWAEWDHVRGASVGRDGGRLSLADGNGRFAYQAIIGAAVPLASLMPGLVLTAEYRFLGTSPLHLQADFISGRGLVTRGQVETGNINHSLLIGLRQSIGGLF